jgi:hypothetical protein
MNEATTVTGKNIWLGPKRNIFGRIAVSLVAQAQYSPLPGSKLLFGGVAYILVCYK